MRVKELAIELVQITLGHELGDVHPLDVSHRNRTPHRLAAKVSSTARSEETNSRASLLRLRWSTQSDPNQVKLKTRLLLLLGPLGIMSLPVVNYYLKHNVSGKMQRALCASKTPVL